MSSTVSSTPTHVPSETDFDMDSEIETRDSTAVPSSSPVPSDGKTIKQFKKIGVIGDGVSAVSPILLCARRVEHQRVHQVPRRVETRRTGRRRRAK
jgi:hypothetical protein